MRAVRTVVSCSVAGWLLCGVAASTACAQQPEISKIRTVLREHKSSIASISVAYTLRTPPAEPLGTDEWMLSKWDWAQSGARQLLIQHPATIPGSNVVLRRWLSYDGQEGFEVDYWPPDLTKVRTVYQTPDPPGSLAYFSYVPWLCGWSVPGSDLDLISLLHRPDAEIVGREAVGDAECVKLDLGPVASRGREANHVYVWIDEAAGSLPRRIFVAPIWWVKSPPPSGSQLQLGEGEVFLTTEVESFAQVRAEQLGKDLVFPAQAHFEGLMRGQIVLDKITLNERMPVEHFRPELPIGAEVVSGAATLKPVATVVGGAEGVRVREEALRESRAHLAPPPSIASPAAIDASLPEASWLPKVVLLVSLVCLGAAAFLLIRRVRSGR